MDCVYDYEEVKKEIEFKYTVRELQAEAKREFFPAVFVRRVIKAKHCKTCSVLKTYPEFYKSQQFEDGHFGNCKMCCRKNNLKNYYSNSTGKYISPKNKVK